MFWRCLNAGHLVFNSILYILLEFEPNTSENTSLMAIFFNIFQKIIEEPTIWFFQHLS